MRARHLLLLVLFVSPLSLAHASGTDDQYDPATLTRLEDRALHAEAREQAYLYTELVQIYTTLAGRQMAAGQMEQAAASLKHVEVFTLHIHQALAKDTKKVKDAEKMMELSAFHLRQAIRGLSSDDRPAAEATLAKLNGVHEELLAQVFSH